MPGGIPQLERVGTIFKGQFRAMASPCEVLVQIDDADEAATLSRLAMDEALRIERKFSRYRDDNIIHRINNAQGQPVEVDEETARLLDFANRCHAISDGLFDLTSGILRRAWRFDGSDRIPQQSTIDSLLAHIGWQRVQWQSPTLTLPVGMEIDLGGIGKEYAVDRTLGLLSEQSEAPLLVNFGGDLHCNGPRSDDTPWVTGIDNPASNGNAVDTLQLFRGALATSGDAFRFLQKDGVRYSHILNPLTGWPTPGAPRSVTVAADNCTDAGILATLSMLHGEQAEPFLDAQQVKYWVLR